MSRDYFDYRQSLNSSGRPRTTNEYRVMAFFQSDKGASWLRMNVSRIRFGVLERTQYFHTGKTETQICLPGPGFNEKIFTALAGLAMAVICPWRSRRLVQPARRICL